MNRDVRRVRDSALAHETVKAANNMLTFNVFQRMGDLGTTPEMQRELAEARGKAVAALNDLESLLYYAANEAEEMIDKHSEVK